MKEIYEPFDPDQLVTARLPVSQSGRLNNEAGTIDNLAGACLLSSRIGWPIGNSIPERFALIHFRALSEAQGSLFSMHEGRSGITQVPVSGLSAEHLYFEPETITVVPAKPVDFSPWQKDDNYYDVNGIDGITPLDALLIVNYINSHLGDPILPTVDEPPALFYDVNGDNLCTAHDVLLVVNFMLSQADEMEHRP